MDLKVCVGKNQFMIWMASLPKGSDWLCRRPAPKLSREQPKARTTTFGIRGPPKKRKASAYDIFGRRGQEEPESLPCPADGLPNHTRSQALTSPVDDPSESPNGLTRRPTGRTSPAPGCRSGG